MGRPVTKRGPTTRTRTERGSRARAREEKPQPKAPDVAARVDFMASMMREGAWTRGRSSSELAQRWGLHTKTVEDDAAEAWRRVCAEADDAEQARPTIAGTLKTALAEAHADKQHKSVAMLADTWSRVVGARAPERSEMTLRMKQLEDMQPPALHAYLVDQRRKLTEAIVALEKEHPELGRSLEVTDATRSAGTDVDAVEVTKT